MSQDTPIASGTSSTLVAPRASLTRQVLRQPVGALCLLFLALVVLVGIFAPFLAPHGADLSRLEMTNAPPLTGDYLLGGDQAGRDIFSRMLHATLGTLRGSAVLLLVALLLGVPTGLVAGYHEGRLDAALSWVANVVLTLPGFVLLVAFYTIIGPRITVSMAVFGVLVAPGYFWLVRSLVRSIRHELYIDAARISGLSDGRIIARHVLGAVRGPVVIHSSFVLAAGIGVQAGLEFLGLGDPADPSWGGMLNTAFRAIHVAPINMLWPAILIGLTTLALVLLGSVIRDALQRAAAPQQPRRKTLDHLRDQEASAEEQYAPQDCSEARRDPPLLRVRGLTIAYPKAVGGVARVVKRADISVYRGEVHGLVGESGSGKSQLAFATLGILPREALVLHGAVELDGVDLLADDEAIRSARGRRIGYVPQEPMSNLDPAFTVGQQLLYGLRAVTGVSRREGKSKLIDLLARVGINDAPRVYDLYPHQISGGMAQRVLIAGALAPDPELLIADEPTTALDVTVQAEVLDLLRELQRERDLTLLLVTHDFGVVADLCDRVSVMQEGRIVEVRPADLLFAGPEHPYTRALLASTLDDVQPREPLGAGGAG